QRLDLLAAEEIAIASNDLGALGDLLLADPDRTPLLGAVIEIAAKLGLVLGRRADGGDAHRRRNLARELSSRVREPTDGLGELRERKRLAEDGVDSGRVVLADLEAAGEQGDPLA